MPRLLARSLALVALVAIAALAVTACGGSQPQASEPSEWVLDREPAFDDRVSRPPPEPVWHDTDPQVVARRLQASAPRRHAPIWRGHRIDVTWVDLELHDAFRVLAEVGNVDIVVADDVKGRVSLRLRRVPWDQVLHTVARLEGLQVELENGIYLITPSGRKP